MKKSLLFPVFLLIIFSCKKETENIQNSPAPVPNASFGFENSVKDVISGFEGKSIGEVSYEIGKKGLAIRLDDDSDYVDLGSGYNLPGPYTVTVWVKPDSLNRWYANILAKYERQQGPYAFSLHYNVSNSWVTLDSLHRGSFETVILDAKDSLKAGNWYFLAFSLGSDTVMRNYVNGKLSSSIKLKAFLKQNNDKVTLGRQGLMFGKYKDLEFKGLIDELKIYQYELNSAIINAEYLKP